jgi:hypothetical protein
VRRDGLLPVTPLFLFPTKKSAQKQLKSVQKI